MEFQKIIKDWLNPIHGLELDPYINKDERHNENGIVYLADLIFVYKYLGKKKELLELKIPTKDVMNNLITKDINTTYYGIYDRGHGESDPSSKYYEKPSQRRIVSHDNLTSISALSYYYGYQHNREIAKHGLTHFMLFDNKYPHSPRIGEGLQVHPRDWFMWLYNGGGYFRLISWLSFPVFFLALLESMINMTTTRPVWYRNIITYFKTKKYPKTNTFINSSGPWLWFIRLESTYDDSYILRFCRYIMHKRFQSFFVDGEINRPHETHWLQVIARIYFRNEKHPVIIATQEISNV